MKDILRAVLALPTRADFAAGLASIHAELRSLLPKRRLRYRVSSGPRVWHSDRLRRAA